MFSSSQGDDVFIVTIVTTSSQRGDVFIVTSSQTDYQQLTL